MQDPSPDAIVQECQRASSPWEQRLDEGGRDLSMPAIVPAHPHTLPIGIPVNLPLQTPSSGPLKGRSSERFPEDYCFPLRCTSDLAEGRERRRLLERRGLAFGTCSSTHDC